MNRAELTLRVFEQAKKEKSVTMRCGLSGKKKEDGTYPKSFPVEVIITDKTEWPHEDMSNKTVDVKGTVLVDAWEKDGKSGHNFKIFAESVAEHVWEK